MILEVQVGRRSTRSKHRALENGIPRLKQTAGYARKSIHPAGLAAGLAGALGKCTRYAPSARDGGKSGPKVTKSLRNRSSYFHESKLC